MNPITPRNPVSRRSVLAGIAALALAPSLAACTTAGSASSAASSSGAASSITIAAFPQGNSLDPWGSWVSNFAIQAGYDTLTRLQPDGTVGPWLATSWEYTDPKTLDMKLRDDVDFTDGTHFTADAVKANLEYGKNANPKNFGSGPYVGAIESIDVVGQYEVRLHLSEANPDLPWAFSRWAGWMVSPKALDNPSGLVSAMVGSGPYVLDAAATTAQQTYTFTKNPKYWADSQMKRFDKVVVKIMDDPKAAANAAAAGTVDYLITQDTSVDVGSLTKGFGGPVSILGFAIQDLQGKISKPLADVRVRQAMNYAIDRKTILDTVQKGAGVVNGSTPFGPTSQGYSAALDTYYTYDPAKAKKLLADAGYANGFTVKVVVNSQFSDMAQSIAGYLRAVGVNLELSNHSTDIFQQTMSGTWAMSTLVTSVDGQAYSDSVNTLTPASVYNPQKNTDPKITALLAKASSETSDKSAQDATFAELAAYAQQQAWMVTPVLFKTGYAYDAKKIAIDSPQAVIVPDLWYLSPAS